MSTVEDMASAVKLAYWDINKAAVLTARNIHKTAQNWGMKYQNWKHKGAGEGTAAAASAAPATTSGGKQWSSEESTTFYNTQTTYYVHTRKEK
jgi:hypothetical protein